jgi:hypothetical protein
VEGARDRGKINNDRITATMYSLGTGFVSGIRVWMSCIKKTMIMMMMITISN